MKNNNEKYSLLYLFELAHTPRILPHDQHNQMLMGTHRTLPNMIHTHTHTRSLYECEKNYYKEYNKKKRIESLRKGKGREVKSQSHFEP